MKINTICDALLTTLDEVGYSENTTFGYKGVVRRLKAFCENTGIPNTHWTSGKRMLMM